MANNVYSNFKRGLLSGSYDLASDVVTVGILTGSSYTPNYSTDTTWNLYARGDCLVSGTLTGKLITSAGVFTATDHIFSTVTTGKTITKIVVFHSSSGDLVCTFTDDTGGAISVPTNGGDVTIDWNASGIFAL